MRTESSPSADERRERMLQLEHELKNHLSAVTLGLQALDGARSDPALFAELQATIQEGGIAPLRSGIAELVKVATMPHEA